MGYHSNKKEALITKNYPKDKETYDSVAMPLGTRYNYKTKLNRTSIN